MTDNFKKQTFTITVLVPFRLLNYKSSTITIFFQASPESCSSKKCFLIVFTQGVRSVTLSLNIFAKYVCCVRFDLTSSGIIKQLKFEAAENMKRDIDTVTFKNSI